jgi:hypothetical protein
VLWSYTVSLSQFYTDILLTMITGRAGASRAIDAAQGDPAMEPPSWYSSCTTRHEYLAQLQIDIDRYQHRLKTLHDVLRSMVAAVKRARISHHLTDTQMEIMKGKLAAFEVCFQRACNNLDGYNMSQQQLIKLDSET